MTPPRARGVTSVLTQPNSEECVRVRSTEHDIHVIAIVNILNGTTHRRLANYHGAYQDARTSTRASTLPDRTREHVTYSSCILRCLSVHTLRSRARTSHDPPEADTGAETSGGRRDPTRQMEAETSGGRQERPAAAGLGVSLIRAQRQIRSSLAR